MSEVKNDVAAVIASAKPDPTRPVTASDVLSLAGSYRRLAEANKAHTQAVSTLRKGLAVFNQDTDTDALQVEVEVTAKALANALAAERRTIAGLPNGTTAKGGATRQTVVLEFYGAVNRNLAARLSGSDARKINAASFGS